MEWKVEGHVYFMSRSDCPTSWGGWGPPLGPKMNGKLLLNRESRPRLLEGRGPVSHPRGGRALELEGLIKEGLRNLETPEMTDRC